MGDWLKCQISQIVYTQKQVGLVIGRVPVGREFKPPMSQLLFS